MKRVASVLIAIGSVAINSALIAGCWETPSEQEIRVSAPEDILGLGFAFLWVFVLIAQALLINGAARLAAGDNRRSVAAVLLAIFVASSLVAFVGYRRQMAVVLGVSKVSVEKALFF